MTTAQESQHGRMVDALEAVDRVGLDSVFAEDVTVRASLPRRNVECSGRAEAVELMLGWFRRDATGIARVWHTVERVADVWQRDRAGKCASTCMIRSYGRGTPWRGSAAHPFSTFQ